MAQEHPQTIDISLEAQRYSGLDIVFAALKKLQDFLPTNLLFHNINHTIDVLNEAILFGTQNALDGRSLELLAIAAAYHDIGFITQSTANEEIGANEAKAAMQTTARYSEQEITLVHTMILDTTLIVTERGAHQVPKTELSKYLCDADLSNLGRADFFERSDLFWQEIGKPDKASYWREILKFLECHVWYTSAAEGLRQQQKESNIAVLRGMIA